MLTTLAAFSLAIAIALVGAEPPGDVPLRVLSYNIHHGEGTDGRVDLDRLARVIRAARPDLVALQEVDKGVRRSGSVDQVAELARLTGLHGSFARQIDYDGGEYGQAFLSRVPIERLTIHLLPGEPDREQRIAAEALVTLEGRAILFVTTHLHHASPAFRERQATRINELFGASDRPVILAGDLNAPPKSAPLAILARDWTIDGGDRPAPTFPAKAPDRKIDFVLARSKDGIRLGKSEVPDEPVASDHRPLLVELQLPAR